MCVGGGDVPQPIKAEVPAEAPQYADENVRSARGKESKRLRAMSGRSSTIVTGAQGLTSSASTAGKTALGA